MARRETPRKSKKKQEDDDLGYDFEMDIEIDPFNLDVEVLKYPRLVGQYSALAASANRLAKRADERVKTCRSELIKSAWETPEVMGRNVKPSVQTVEAYYRNDDDYKKYKNASIEAQYYADILNGCASAINNKRYALADALRLLAMEYFEVPKVPKGAEDLLEKMQKGKRAETFDKIRNALNKQDKEPEEDYEEDEEDDD